MNNKYFSYQKLNKKKKKGLTCIFYRDHPGLSVDACYTQLKKKTQKIECLKY